MRHGALQVAVKIPMNQWRSEAQQKPQPGVPKRPVMITTNLHPPMGIDISWRINSFTFYFHYRSSPPRRKARVFPHFPVGQTCQLSTLTVRGLQGPANAISFGLIYTWCDRIYRPILSLYSAHTKTCSLTVLVGNL